MQLWQLINSNPTPVYTKEGERRKGRGREMRRQKQVRRRRLERRAPASGPGLFASRTPTTMEICGETVFYRGPQRVALRHAVANGNPASRPAVSQKTTVTSAAKHFIARAAIGEPALARDPIGPVVALCRIHDPPSWQLYRFQALCWTKLLLS